MTDYTTKIYGRNQEVADIYKLFGDGRDVSMPGPRRLGKTFVLERLVANGQNHKFHAIKIELAGCTDTRSVFRRLCEAIGRDRKVRQNAIAWAQQRIGQLVSPRSDQTGPWYQPLLSLDHESLFERYIRSMNADDGCSWALLIDELPIFLKALHDKGPEGVKQALAYMNLLSRLRAENSRVRWLITGSIGIEPLARAGNYLGVLAKFTVFPLDTLTPDQAIAYVRDLAVEGRLPTRTEISEVEAVALVNATGWRAAYYLEALAQQMSGAVTHTAEEAASAVNQAVNKLLTPAQLPTFGTWEEHIRKHYVEPEQSIAFTALRKISRTPQGLSIGNLLAEIARADLTREKLLSIVFRLHTEGFLTVAGWDSEEPGCAFLNPLLRQWWHRFPPANA